MVPVRVRTLSLLAAAAMACAAASAAHAQDENPTTPGAIPNPGSYQGSVELQRREQQQQQQYQQQQRQPDTYAPQRQQPGYAPGGGGAGARGAAPNPALEALQRRDYATAYRLTLPLAQRGDRVAQYNIGQLYTKGLGVARDDAQAAIWYQRSAAQGFARAANDLAIAYAFGRGVPLDYVQSYIWVTRAAGFAQDQDARNDILANRTRLIAQMTPAQLARAQSLAGGPPERGRR